MIISFMGTQKIISKKMRMHQNQSRCKIIFRISGIIETDITKFKSIVKLLNLMRHKLCMLCFLSFMHEK